MGGGWRGRSSCEVQGGRCQGERTRVKDDIGFRVNGVSRASHGAVELVRRLEDLERGELDLEDGMDVGGGGRAGLPALDPGAALGVVRILELAAVRVDETVPLTGG